MKPAAARVLTATLVALVLLSVFILDVERRDVRHAAIPEDVAATSGISTGRTDEAGRTEPGNLDLNPMPSRKLLVASEAGIGLVDADVAVWSREIAEANEGTAAQQEIDVGEQAPVHQSRTGNDGAIVLPTELRSNQRSLVAVAAKPGYGVVAIVLDRHWGGGTVLLRLESRPLAVHVVDAVGKPLSGAQVVVEGEVPFTAGGELYSQRFAHEYVANLNGEVVVPYLRGSRLHAREQASISRPVFVDDQDRVTLKVRETFTVRFVRDATARNTGRLRIEVDGGLGTWTKEMAAGSMGASETAKEVIVPCVARCTYMARGLADGWISEPVEIVAPSPGNVYEVPMKAAGTRDWSVRVVDQNKNAIVGARVKCSWMNNAGQTKWVHRMSDAHGRIKFESLPDAAVRFVAQKPGYFQTLSVEEWTQYPRSAETLIEMESGLEISGRVRCLDEPVEDFCVWYASAGRGWFVEYFDASANGEFKLRGLPAGPVELVASVDMLGQSSVRELILSAAVDQVVDLDVPGGSVTGRCRVVDAETGTPIAGAEVEVQLQAGGETIGGDGMRWLTDRSGAAHWRGVIGGTNRISVAAHEYECVMTSAFYREGPEVDFGLIRLRRAGQLEIRLVPDGALRLDWCSVMLVGGRAFPRIFFNAEGRAEFNNVPPGLSRIEILRSDAVEEIIQLDLEPARDGSLEIPITVGERLSVELSDRLASQAAGAEAVYRSSNGWSRRTYASSGGGARFAVPVDPSLVNEIEIQDVGANRILSRVLTSEERAAALVRIDQADSLRVVVQDGRGQPIGSVSVLARRSGGDADVVLDARTDEDGRAEIAGMGWELADVLVFHPQIGVRPSERVDVKELAGRTLELELNPIGRTRVAVRDGEVAIAGVQVRFLDPKYNAGRAMTDEEGVAWSLPLQEGKYRAEVGQSGYWPAAIDFECNKEEVWTTLQVRRTGGLDLEIQSASARDVRSYVLELRSKEFEASVSGWLGAGKVVSPQGGRPDKDGRLELYGLPNGEYTWTAILDGAGVMAGEIQVGPHTVNKKKLMLP